MKNTDPFAPWNDTMKKDDVFAPHNDPMKRDDLTKPWNNEFMSNQGLTKDERDYYANR